MAALSFGAKILKLPLKVPYIAFRGAQRFKKVNKTHIRAGRFRPTRLRELELSYDEAKPPHLVGVEKSWNTWNTSNLSGEGRKSETLLEDSFIRHFLTGTWHSMILTEVVIKRRHNTIYIAGLITEWRDRQALYFLTGYTEELLSCLLKCVVKLEFQTVANPKDLVFKTI